MMYMPGCKGSAILARYALPLFWKNKENTLKDAAVAINMLHHLGRDPTRVMRDLSYQDRIDVVKVMACLSCRNPLVKWQIIEKACLYLPLYVLDEHVMLAAAIERQWWFITKMVSTDQFNLVAYKEIVRFPYTESCTREMCSSILNRLMGISA